VTYFKKLFILLLSALFLTQAAASEPLEKVSLQLQWLDQFQFAGYYMALEKGFYKEAGLDVTLKPYQANISVVDEVNCGNATYGTGRSSLLIDRSQGKNITALAAIFQSSPLILISLKRDDLNTITDFKGKRFMSIPDASSTVAVQAMIASHGVALTDMILQNHSLKLQDLIDNKTDIMAAYLSNEPYLLRRKGVNYTIFDPKEYGFDFYGDILFTSQKEATLHHDRAQKFLEASLKGWKYAFNHINQSAQLIHDKYNVQHKSLDALKFEGEVLKQLSLKNGTPLGDINPQKLQKIFDIYKVLNLTSKNISLENFIFTQKNIKLTKKEKHYIQKHQNIDVCMDLDFPPYTLKHEEYYTGVTVDYLNLIAQKTHLNFNYIPMTNKTQTDAYLTEKKCDMIPHISIHDKSHTLVQASQKYIDEHISMVTSVKQPYIDSLTDIGNKKVGIIYGINHLCKELKVRYPNLDLVEISTPKEGLSKVRSGKLYGFLAPYRSLSYAIAKSYVGELKIAIKLESPHIEVGFGVRADQTQLLQIINKALHSITFNERQSIYQNWINPSITPSRDYKLLIQLTIFMLLVFAVLLYRHQLLKQKNSELNQLKDELEKLNLSLEVKISDSVTELRKKDQLMMQQSRLAQLGEMISMIAHQWRQPLAAISSTVVSVHLKNALNQYDLCDKKSQKEYKEYLNQNFTQIETYVQTLSNTIDDFRNFYKSEKVSTLININSAIEKTLKIIERALVTDNITLVKEFHSTQSIEVFENELLQVFLNIMKNAQDNFKEKALKAPLLKVKTYDTPTSIKIEISDNGGGIHEQYHTKIYDPYFSTKSKKNGTGLGLYMSKMIIEDHHNGMLTHQNRNGGVCFCIELFRAQHQPESDKTEQFCPEL
jgi:ABC-type nitrate/sulfonate/bicarbonate transport system substrate-binding protein/signal transduction histidine kinase